MMDEISNRKLDIGIVHASILVLVQVLYALTFYFDFLSESSDIARSIIYQATFAYAYISVLMLIRRILSKDKVLINNVLWIIRLEGIKALGNIILFIGVYSAAIVVYICSLVLTVFYILSMVRIFNSRNAGRSEIIKLGPILISLVICFLLASIGGAYAGYERFSEIYGASNLIMAIPFVLLVNYFKGFKIRQVNLDI